MRKTNLKVLLAVLGGTIVLAGVVFGVHYLQRKRIASALLWQARKAEETGQVERHVRFLGRYLDFRPDDLDEKARLGRTLLTDEVASSPQARNRAIELLDDVLRQQPDRPAERRALVKGALGLPGRTRLARESLTVLLDPAKPNPANLDPADLGELEGFWGALFEQEGNAANAILWCRKAIKNRPDDQANYLRLAGLLRRQTIDDPAQRDAANAEASQVMDALVASNGTSASAFLARWRFRREHDLVQLPNRPAASPLQVPFDAATADMREALRLAPENLDVLLAASDAERLKSVRSTARDLLRRAQDTLSRQGRANPNDLHVQQVNWQLANVLLDDALIERDPGPKRDAALAALAEARPAIDALRKNVAMKGAADYLEGRLQFQHGKWADAKESLQKARTQLSDRNDLAAQIELFLGQCYEKLDEPALMFQSFQKLAALDPTSIAGQVGMASAYWMQGRVDDALAIYAKLSEQGRVPSGSWRDVARLALAQQLQRDPAKRNWTAAEQALANAEKDEKRSPDVALIRVELLAAQEKFAEAEQLLAKAIQEKPKQEAELWVLRADLARRQKQPERAAEILAEAAKLHGDGVPIRLARVRLAVDRGPGEAADPREATGRDAAKAALAKAEEGLDKLPADQQAQLLEGLAGAHFRLGNAAEARRLSAKLAATDPHKNDPRLQLFLLEMALRADDEPAVQRALETIQQQEQGHGPYTRYGMALKSLAQARKIESSDKRRDALLDEARRQLDLVATKKPSWAPVHTARAEVYEVQGSYEQAIAELRLAMNAGDNGPVVLQRLVRLLIQRQRDNEADDELKKLQETAIASSGELSKLFALVAARKGDPSEALRRMRATVVADSNDFRDVIWMARMQAAAGQFDDAEKGLRKATTLAPKDPEPWVALVQFLTGRKRGDDAAAALAEAQAKVEPKRKAILLALCHEAAGKIADAVAEIEKAEKAEGDNILVVRHAVRFYLRGGKLDLAEKALRRVLAGEVKTATAEDKDWARRGLALALANGNDFARFREALDLVGLGLDDKGRLPRDNPKERPDPDLLRTQARVLATQPQNSFRARAIDLFERLDRAQSLTDDDRLMLALLLDRAGNWPKAKEQYLQLAIRANAGPQTLVQFSLGLIRQKETGMAEQFVERLEKLEKDRNVPAGTYGSQELRSRLHEAAGDIDKGYAMLKAHVERTDAAKEELLALVAYSSRHKRLEEGLKVCVAARATCKPEAVGAATVALLRACKGSDDQCKEAEAWLTKAIADNPKKLVLRMHLANLYDFRGAYRQAEEQYRELLKPGNEPNNVVGLNNLAWLLALQPGKGVEGLEIVTKAIASAGRRPELLDTRGTILLGLGRNEEALIDLKEAAADSPNATRLFHLARAHHAVKDRDAAARALRKAKELGLQPDTMHPVEQEACKKLMGELRL